MAVITRIDSRSQKNQSIQVQDLLGNVLCTIEAAPCKGDLDAEKFRHEANLRIEASDRVRIVKSNGAILGRK